MKKLRRIFLIGLAALGLLCLLAASISFISNQFMPSGPAALDRLELVDKNRLSESLHLRQALGETIWPTFGEAEIPVIVWNDQYSFLVGMSALPQGWEIVPSDHFNGKSYYRQKSDNPQNFAVPVGESWAASMATKHATDQFMIDVFQDFLPPVIENIFPYRLLIQPSEVQITAVNHESFHVLQQFQAGQRLERAERSYQLEEAYWQVDPEMQADWEEEITLLISAVRAEDTDKTADLVSQFLEKRQSRRQSSGLEAGLVDFEHQIEWEEGLAKYVELALWQAASQDSTYHPVLSGDPYFKDYETFEQRFSQELSQLGRQASQEGTTRFYYTGMAEAFLLDRLMPDWKERAFDPSTWLEDLLAEAVAIHR